VTPLSLGDALRSPRALDPAWLTEFVQQVGGFPNGDAVVYLIDFAQTILEPLPRANFPGEVLPSEEVATTMAGRAFIDGSVTSAPRPDGTRVWVPIVEGSDRTGVLAVTVPLLTDEASRTCEEVGALVGYLIATHARTTDLYNQHRRRRALSLAASMQWDLLPPLVLKTDRLAIAGLLEPAYEVAGDCFDYALNGSSVDVGVFDPLGHGVTSALTAALCVGSYRHDRREGQTLEQIHTGIDTTVAAQIDPAFATGQVARVDLDSGMLHWTNAGHPLPLLIRGGRVVGELVCPPTLPWGLAALGRQPPLVTVASEPLEPGDSVLFYTDGVVEAHVPGGEQFGPDRLADLAGQHASDQLEPEEIVRLLIRSVLEHQNDHLGDDATLVLFQWYGPDR
jgi:serine phosphatase RsbU (regulator of sigma subunit)